MLMSAPPPPKPLETTATLLARARDGDAAAHARLAERFLPILRRWAHGRLPARARDLSDTDDLVQITLIRALEHVGEFEPRREGAFVAYLRRILLNAMRDEIRRADRRPGREDLGDKLRDERASVIERAIGREALERYETALGRLPEEQREGVMLRIEFGYTFQEIADALGKPSANTARMMVSRALARLAGLMEERA
jgi:RNA polymerase sigma-70 factor (ECF subfamily)